MSHPEPKEELGTWQQPYTYKVYTLQVCKALLNN